MKLIDVVRIIIKAIYDQVTNCLRYNLHCMDPPCITSGMLDRFGLHNYSSKMSFWKAVEEIIEKYNNVELFKSRFGLFRLAFHHDIEEVYRISGTDVYIDVLDCDIVKCDITPRSHVLRVYLEGMYGNRITLRINIIMLIKMAIYENPYFRECLEGFVQNPFQQQTITTLLQCILAILYKHKSIFDMLFVKRPKDVNEVLKKSSLLRRYLSTSEQ
jgi:hypothetical protein